MFIFHLKKINVIRGAIVYGVFDAVAALFLGQFSWLRYLGITFIGATIYTLEIPNYFNWIESRCKKYTGQTKKVIKTLYALLYFNPLWIARHLFFIDLLTFGSSSLDIITVSLKSFAFNIPIAFFANYFIQNQVKLNYRYLCSAIFSGIMALYYAFSKVLFL